MEQRQGVSWCIIRSLLERNKNQHGGAMATLKQHRLRKPWTLREFAREAGVSQQSIVNAEAGRPLRIATMRKMATALGVDVWDVDEFAAALEAMGEGNDGEKVAA
jgi:transcriptional regulator with XRE-family HTH domain